MDRSFDIEYWQRLGAAAIFEAAWQMAVDAHGRGAGGKTAASPHGRLIFQKKICLRYSKTR